MPLITEADTKKLFGLGVSVGGFETTSVDQAPHKLLDLVVGDLHPAKHTRVLCQRIRMV